MRVFMAQWLRPVSEEKMSTFAAVNTLGSEVAN